MPHPENRLLIVMPETPNGAEAERLTMPNPAFGLAISRQRSGR